MLLKITLKFTLLSLLATVSHPVPIDEHIPCYPASTTLTSGSMFQPTVAPEACL